MKSPFAIKNSANETPRYTTFDWTHGNNLTFGIKKRHYGLIENQQSTVA